MRIITKNQYNTVLKEIDSLLELSFLNQGQTRQLKDLLAALDNYQNMLFNETKDATIDLAKEFSLKGQVVLN